MQINRIYQIILITCVTLSVYGYFYNPQHGVKSQRILSNKIINKKRFVSNLEQEIIRLKKTIVAWKESSWPEQYQLRSQFVMGFSNELVYLMPQTRQSCSSSASS